MKKNLLLKRLFSVLFLLFISTISWAYDFEVDGIYYNKNSDGTSVTVTYKNNYNIYSGTVVIPSSVEYNDQNYTVTSIGSYAFYNCSGLTSITIPNSVTSIGYEAFYGCSGLNSITIPESVTSIDSWAFSGCSGLTSINVAPGNTKYDSRDNCNAIINTTTNTLFIGCKSSVIPNSVTSIGERAFFGCKGLTSINIPDGVTSIGSSAFSGCSGLTSITIPNSVTSIDIYTFSGCSGLTSVTIGDNVTSIGERAFYNCSGLTSINIPNSVTSIDHSAFSGCSGLTSVSIGNGVTSIGGNAFYGCKFRTIVSKAVNPANYSIESVGFSDATYLHTPLYVPENSFWNYVYGTEWYRFNIIKEYAATEVEARQAYMLADTDGTNFTVYNAASDKLVTKEYMHQVDETSLGSNWVAEPCGAGVALLNLGAEKYAQISNDGKISLSDTPQELDIEFNDGVATANGRQMMLVLNDDDDITDVVTLRYTPSASEDSFDPNAPIYDLNGRRLTEKPKSGYYIQGGKKYRVN